MEDFRQPDEEGAKERRFKTYDEWKKFYHELKAQEREERRHET